MERSAPKREGAVEEMGVEHFVRHFGFMLKEQEGRFAFFLGAGCSISSGIEGASTLVVARWLQKLYRQETGATGSPTDVWLEQQFDG